MLDMFFERQARPKKYQQLHYNIFKYGCYFNSMSLVSKLLFQEMLGTKLLVKRGSISSESVKLNCSPSFRASGNTTFQNPI